jgi:hypothetical protein
MINFLDEEYLSMAEARNKNMKKIPQSVALKNDNLCGELDL